MADGVHILGSQYLRQNLSLFLNEITHYGPTCEFVSFAQIFKKIYFIEHLRMALHTQKHAN